MALLHLTRTILPPIGYLAPAKQLGIYTASHLNIADLSGKAQQSLPVGFEVILIGSGGSAVEIYGWAGTNWEDELNSGTVTSTDLSGQVQFNNPADYDVEFVW